MDEREGGKEYAYKLDWVELGEAQVDEQPSRSQGEGVGHREGRGEVHGGEWRPRCRLDQVSVEALPTLRPSVVINVSRLLLDPDQL
jgi:hypothetical protein